MSNAPGVVISLISTSSTEDLNSLYDPESSASVLAFDLEVPLNL